MQRDHTSQECSVVVPHSPTTQQKGLPAEAVVRCTGAQSPCRTAQGSWSGSRRHQSCMWRWRKCLCTRESLGRGPSRCREP
eukprot:365826-Chlamydomonas_euryale.AAC.5